MNSRIQFFSEEIQFTIKRKTALREWLEKSIKEEGKTPWYINFIFCSDRYLLELNKTYLNHHFFTDVLTFTFSEDENNVSGDVYISIERVKENAEKYRKTFENELHRVIIHAVLHLIGYNDFIKHDKMNIRLKEDYYLLKFSD